MTKILEGNNQLLLCRKCGVNPQRASHTWCLDCYHKYKNKWDNNNEEHNKEYKKEWEELHKGYYLYIILNKFNEVLYVGSTENIYTRIHNHLSCNSNIKELMQTEKWHKIKYLDVTDLVYNREELNYLENVLIEVYEPEWNTKLNIIKNIDKLREFSLLAELHSYDINKNFKTYITRKEYQDQKKTKKKVI